MKRVLVITDHVEKSRLTTIQEKGLAAFKVLQDKRAVDNNDVEYIFISPDDVRICGIEADEMWIDKDIPVGFFFEMADNFCCDLCLDIVLLE